MIRCEQIGVDGKLETMGRISYQIFDDVDMPHVDLVAYESFDQNSIPM